MEQVKICRYVNEANVEAVKNSPCVITETPPPSDCHHVRTRGSFGHDYEWNLCPLTRELHTEFHKIGFTTFANKYPKFKAWLLYNGWEFNDFTGRWWHE